MIKKLSKRICWIITIALSIIVVGIILLFTILNYRNTINTATIMMDRFTNRDIKKNVDENKKIEVDKPTIEGVYYVQIEDSHVISNSNIVQDKIIEEYALSEKMYLSWNTKQIIDACIIRSTGKTGEIV